MPDKNCTECAVPLFPDPEVAAAIGALAFTNPFTPQRVALEERALGEAFVAVAPLWVVDPVHRGDNPNIALLRARAEALVAGAREGLAAAGDAERRIYEELVVYLLWDRYEDQFYERIVEPGTDDAGRTRRMPFYERFAHDAATLLPGADAAHLFALFFQVRRAFHFTFRHILGGSAQAAALRAGVWESVFTHDMRRYRASLFARMHELSTLIVGPSGTGKELVAAAIGLSGYIPFDPRERAFGEDFRACHQPVNLAALPATIVESELFGHKRGAFTGAVADRAGYLEGRGPAHAVFLDEIGELSGEVQVKLLRVLQTREFQRLGETRARRFGGKVIAATNRDLPAEIAAGHFREDLYYRLCSDVVRTPSLAEQIEDRGELRSLVRLLAERVVGPALAAEVAEDTCRWIDAQLADHDWPGNVRELEQCVRNVLVRGRYRPPARTRMVAAPAQALADDVVAGRLTADALLGRYCALVYRQAGDSYEAAARRLQMDRRTVKSRLDAAFLKALEADEGGRPP